MREEFGDNVRMPLALVHIESLAVLDIDGLDPLAEVIFVTEEVLDPIFEGSLAAALAAALAAVEQDCLSLSHHLHQPARQEHISCQLQDVPRPIKPCPISCVQIRVSGDQKDAPSA